ncbi:hypothetical protein OIO90_000934 [Microbotryomycetes sp. JL221]|nr:hypothetical protein OIO90_000934 [Microbotryomycetes sp. JL221]
MPTKAYSAPRDESHKLAMQPLTTTRGFTFPSLFSFPPFFTQQPNVSTWTHQRQQWTTLILAYCKFHKTSRLELTDATCDLELFNNKLIKRRLPLSTLRIIIESMVSAGQAEYDVAAGVKSLSSSKRNSATAVLVYWRRPEEWATVIYDWIKQTGQTNSIMTFWELTEGGDLVHLQEFYQLPEPVLRRALDTLVKQGKAQVFKGVGEDGDGVKFA